MSWSASSLESVVLLEKDKNGDVLFAWSYPGVSGATATVLQQRSTLHNDLIFPFVWSRWEGVWVNAYSQPVTDTTSRVVAFSVVLLSKEFNPEKFEALCKLLATAYASSGTPIKVLEYYLSVFVRNKVSGPFGSFADAEYDARKALLVTSIKDIVNMFGLEVIIVWNAMLMKKRIVVYSENLDILLKVIRALPLFVWHRQDWNILRPYVNMTPEQLQELAGAGVYVAGFTDGAIKLKNDYYDVLVDVNTRTVSVAEHAVGDFKMGVFHKELALYLLKSSESAEVAPQTIVKELAMKTKDLLSKLALLRVGEDDAKYVSLDDLRQRKLPPNMDTFLFNVAAAENMTKNTTTQ